MFEKNVLLLHSLNGSNAEQSETLSAKHLSGCSSARLEYASGGRVVAGSNPVTPTGKEDIRSQATDEDVFFLFVQVSGSYMTLLQYL